MRYRTKPYTSLCWSFSNYHTVEARGLASSAEVLKELMWPEGQLECDVTSHLSHHSLQHASLSGADLLVTASINSRVTALLKSITKLCIPCVHFRTFQWLIFTWKKRNIHILKWVNLIDIHSPKRSAGVFEKSGPKATMEPLQSSLPVKLSIIRAITVTQGCETVPVLTLPPWKHTCPIS